MSEQEKLKEAIKDVAMTITSIMIWLLCVFGLVAIGMLTVNAIFRYPVNDDFWNLAWYLTFGCNIGELLIDGENSLFITMTDRIKSILEDK